MKKILCLFLIVLLMSACSLKKELPSKSVEEYLMNYKSLKNSVLSELSNIVNDMEYTSELKKKYESIMKKQYSNIDYKIEDTTINGKNASVQAKVTVLNFYQTMSDANAYRDYNMNEFIKDGEYDKDKFNLFLINSLEETTKKVDYDIEFKLVKKDNKWVIDNIDSSVKEKLQGIYNYNE